MRAVLIPLLLLCVGSALAVAQVTEKDRGRKMLGANSEGTHFFVGFMENEVPECPPEGYPQHAISVASRFATHVSVILPAGNAFQFDLKPYELRSLEVDPDLECTGEGVFHKGIEIRSDKPVSVYCYSSRPLTSDGYLALPVEAWGRDYITANYPVDSYTPVPLSDTLCSVTPRSGEFAIIASEDNTQVAVYPKTRTVTSTGPMIIKTLMRGDIFQVQDGGSRRGATDITGSVINSDKPVGVLSGHVRAAVPVYFESKDHLIEMLPPRNTLGKRHVAVPFGGRLGGDILRIISSDPSPTSVTISTPTQNVRRTLTALGDFTDFELTEVAVVTTDKPVLVAQYSKSAGADPRNNDSLRIEFDPYMVVVTPEEQFVNAAVFQTLPNFSPYDHVYPQYQHHYVTLVAEQQNFTSIRLNGKPLADYPGYTGGIVNGTPFVWASVEVADGRVHVLTGDCLFGGYVYGLGHFDSYGWPIGSGLRKFDQDDKIPPVIADSVECGGVSFTATENGTLASGLRDVWLDSSASDNVTFQRELLVIGDEYNSGHLTLIDPRKPGKARLIAEDLAGNLDTLDVPVNVQSALSFPEDSLLWSNVEVGQTYSRVITLKNLNASSVAVDEVVLQNRKEFLMLKTYKGDTVPSGGSYQIEVLFHTVNRSDARDTLVIKCPCETYKIPLLALIGAPKIGTHDLEFGTLRTGRSRTMSLRVFNAGTIDLRLDSAVLQKDPFSLGTTVAASVVLPAGKDSILKVAFTPQQIGDFKGTVTFYSNADSAAVSHLHGVAVYPSLSISGYDYDSVQVGDTVCARVAIVNVGGDTAHVTDIRFADPTAFLPDRSGFPRELAAGDTLWVTVCFAPDHVGPFISQIDPENTDGAEAQNTLRGVGYLMRGWISGYDWKERWIGTKSDTVVFLHNNGTSALTVYSVWISDGDVGDFAVEPLQDSIKIAPGDSSPVKVAFSPMLPGLRSCLIHATTSSRQTTVVDSVLQGFGLVALSSDKLEFDSTIAYSCGERHGKITIFNDGNTPLTLRDFQIQSSPALVTFSSASVAGDQIAIGDSLVINFTIDFAGYIGKVNGSISWSFAELPDTIHRSFAVTSEPQQYSITASTPQSVGIGGKFNLIVRVDGVHWPKVGHSGVELRIESNPTVARFDEAEWSRRSSAVTSGWKPSGTPQYEKPGIVKLTFLPVGGDSLWLDSVAFLAIPFQGYLGNKSVDTFKVTMTVAEVVCAPPSLASVPYRVDSICGLSSRLLLFTGQGYVLKQSVPNPSGTEAIIDFTLGMEAPTKLELFGADGRSVKTMIDATLPAGSYSVPVDVRLLPSGLYYYRLTSGPFGAVRSMTVVK
jgi:hypothetical protein